ncbi:hypothetical protein GW932_02360 [archaeon]|nr:hypothetical protein [archaeon]
MTKRELRHVKNLAKKLVPKETLKKIKKIKDRNEKIDLYKHSLKSNLELRIHSIEKEIKKHEKKHDVFNLYAKTKLLNLKIQYFYVTHNKKDLKLALKLIKEVEGELKKLS